MHYQHYNFAEKSVPVGTEAPSLVLQHQEKHRQKSQSPGRGEVELLCYFKLNIKEILPRICNLK
ncbi:MAG: hypothetical protein COA78_12190 [Blastopirellula sp.]|nr:MAG: hypothetical protein COA78_12190 [Blastopirellula sp.]